jgi:hypothetical protein
VNYYNLPRYTGSNGDLIIELDPEKSLVLMETNLPTPMTARVYVNLPEGNGDIMEIW